MADKPESTFEAATDKISEAVKDAWRADLDALADRLSKEIMDREAGFFWDGQRSKDWYDGFDEGRRYALDHIHDIIKDWAF